MLYRVLGWGLEFRVLKGSWDLVSKGLGVPFKGTVGFYNRVPFKGLGVLGFT